MPDAPSFAHLHCHTDYSMLDGAAPVDKLFAEFAAQGMPAGAVTDHGNVFHAIEAIKAGKKHGVKAIVGLEAYVAPQVSRTHKERVYFGKNGKHADDVSGDGSYTHMTLLAETNEGMRNIFKMNSIGEMDGYRRKGRIDRELMSAHGRGVIATTGCPGGEVQTLIRVGRYEDAVQAASDFRDIFGAGNYFLELMDHGLPVERNAREALLRLAKTLDLPLLATNDLHYVQQGDAPVHDAMLCIQSGSQLSQEKRFKFDGTDYYVRTAAEMRHTFRELPEACDNTLLVAERCNVSVPEHQNLMPRFPVPDGHTEESWFRAEVARGLDARYPDGVPEYASKQADYEMDVIAGKGYSGYFLVTADFINWAKDNGIRVGPGRGSGAGSMCAYAMRITDLDPVPLGLIFERFLNPERASMPDFDVDFDDERRGEVIQYVTEKYGSERVAAILTIGKLKTKAAIKDAARVLGYPFGTGERITKALPPAVMGKDISLGGIFDPNDKRYAEAKEVRDLYESDPEVKTVIDMAKGLEGMIRQTGVHAAGVIMSAEPLIDHIPLTMRQTDGQIITGFEYPTCEDLGMVKFDFLGLKNLTTIERAVKNIKTNRGVDLVLEDLTLDNPAAYDLLAKGETLGVFQVDGSGMRSLLKMMRPDHFEDISAALALYRPGPMGADSHTNYAKRKNGQQPIQPIHPELAEPLKDILDTTYGLIVYQEQVQQIAQRVAGYTLGAADNLRRAMGKKKKEVLDAEFVPFQKGMRENGFSDDAINALWAILVPFSDYAFNKAHTAAYGLITFWTAYLKANFPAEYMAALLTTNMDDKDKTAVYLNECRRMGISVLAPDVNDSVGDYAAVGDDIRVGLTAIRGVGHNVVSDIIDTRARSGRFASFADYLDAVAGPACAKGAVANLIKAGGFDSMGYHRSALNAIHESAIDTVAGAKKKAAIGQDSLFGEMDAADLGALEIVVPDAPEWDRKTLLSFEREMLGLYVTDHPLNGFENSLRTQTDTTVGALVEAGKPLADPVVIGGLVTGVARKISKASSEPWAILTIEDVDGSMDLMCFSRSYAKAHELLRLDEVLLFKGQVKEDERSGGIMFIVDKVTPARLVEGVPDAAAVPTGTGVARITLIESRCTPEVMARVRATLAEHPGPDPVHLRMVKPDGSSVLFAAPPELNVTRSPALAGELKSLLGPDCLS